MELPYTPFIRMWKLYMDLYKDVIGMYSIIPPSHHQLKGTVELLELQYYV